MILFSLLATLLFCPATIGADVFTEEQLTTAYDFIVISLGHDCSVGLGTRDHAIRSAAYPFDWCLTPFSALYFCLHDDFQHYFQKENLIPSSVRNCPADLLHLMQTRNLIVNVDRADVPYVMDKTLGMIFNHDFPNKYPTTINNMYNDNYAKYQRRISRFFHAMSSGKKVYLIRYYYISKPQALDLHALLKSKFPRTDFTLIVIGDNQADFETPWDIKGIKNFYSLHYGAFDWKILCDAIKENTFKSSNAHGKKLHASNYLVKKWLLTNRELPKNQLVRSANVRHSSTKPRSSSHRLTSS